MEEMNAIGQASARLLKLPDVTAKTTLKRTQLYALSKQGRFPTPVKLSLRSVAWLEHEVDTWIAQRVAASRTGTTTT